MENGKSEKQNDIKRGLRDGIPIALGYLSVSFAFGIMAVSEGLTAWQAILISVANVTSAGQFAETIGKSGLSKVRQGQLLTAGAALFLKIPAFLPA